MEQSRMFYTFNMWFDYKNLSKEDYNRSLLNISGLEMRGLKYMYQGQIINHKYDTNVKIMDPILLKRNFLADNYAQFLRVVCDIFLKSRMILMNVCLDTKVSLERYIDQVKVAKFIHTSFMDIYRGPIRLDILT
jgi:hypothetical protein